jgi:hypothetical protein
MAKIDHTFHMDEAPAQAQRRFEEEIGWELHRHGGFAEVKDVPGEIDYSDGAVNDASDERSFLPGGELAESPGLSSAGHGVGRGAGGAGPTIGAYGGLRELLARHIKVELTPDGTGTLVHIHGHAEGRLRDSILLLGSPGHWPELRWTEGAPTEDR